MPPVVAAVSAVVSAIATVSSWVIVVGGFKLAIGKALLYFAGSIVLSAIARALTPTPEFDQGSALDQGYEVALKFDPAYPRQIVVGRAATGGSLAYAQVTGADNKYLWRVAALSDTVSEGVHAIEHDGVALTFDGDVTTGWRNCTSHFLKEDDSPCLRVRVYLGEQTTADADLVAATSEWTEACVGTGITYAIWRCEYDREAFPTGEPALVFVLDGAHAYDPRDDSTGFTRNASLLAAQFAQGWEINGVRVIGLGATSDDVPEAYTEEGADICEEQVDLAAGGTEDRYQANGLISSYDQPSAVMADFAMAMAGQHIDAGGEIIFRPGRAQTPVHLLGRPLTDLDLLGDAPDDWTPDRPGDELCNTIHSTFVDPSAGWREQPLPIRKDAAAITADGARFVKNRSYRFVTSNTQGQRLNKFALSDARYQGRATIAVGLWGLAYEPGDWEEWTSAYFQGATYKFRIEAVNFDINDGSDGSEPRARVLLSIVETHASIDDWSTDDEDQLNGEFPAQVPITLTMNALTVTAAVVALGGASRPQLRASWDAIESPVATSIEFEYRVVGDTVVYRGAASPEATEVAFDQGVMPAQQYEMRARLRGLDRRGAWTDWEAHSGTTSAILVENPIVSEPFAPGRVGGSGDFVFHLDKTDVSTANVGEIYIAATKFNHPDGVQRTSGLTGTVLTPYGEGVGGRFYLIYTETAKATRFGSLGSQGTATNIFAARVKPSGGWEAFDDTGAAVDVTIAATDCIIAIVEAETTSSGLTGIAPLVAGAAGVDGIDGTNGLDAFLLTLSAGMARSTSGVISKTSATASWGEQAYSPTVFANGGYCSARVLQANKAMMFGLNADPTLDASYTSLDYAWYLRTDGQAEIWESNVSLGVVGSYAANDVFSIVYDNARVRYMQNGTIVRTVAASSGLKLAFDSSFYDQGAAIDGVAYGPLAIAPTRREIRYARSNTGRPATPTGDNPSGWSLNVPTGEGALYSTTGTKNAADVLVGAWSTPTRAGGYNPRGSWNGENTYYADDVVTEGGGTYIALSDNVASVLIMTGTAGDQQLRSPSALALSGATYYKIKARLRCTSGAPTWEGECFYSVPGVHGESASYYRTASQPSGYAQNVWVDVEWDMSALTAGGTDWISNTIGQIRLDLTNTPSNWEIQFIRIESAAGVVGVSWHFETSSEGFSAYYATLSQESRKPSGDQNATAYWGVLAAPGEPGTPASPPSAFTATIDLTSTSSGVNLRTLADAAGYAGGDATVTFEVESGVTVTGLTGSPNGGYAIDTGIWPSDTYTIDLALTIKNGGKVYGGGGRGAGGASLPGTGHPAGAGGDAIYCREAIDITIDAGGELKGGGGGGGGGEGWYLIDSEGSPSDNLSGGDGGGGFPNGTGANPGTTSGGGSGGTGLTLGPRTSGAGGAGGGAAATGTTGAAATGSENPMNFKSSATVGVVGGYAVRKNGETVNVTNNGTMTGTAA